MKILVRDLARYKFDITLIVVKNRSFWIAFNRWYNFETKEKDNTILVEALSKILKDFYSHDNIFRRLYDFHDNG